MTSEPPSDLHHEPPGGTLYQEPPGDRLHREPLSDRLYELLFERVQSCAYPSGEIMDRIEQILYDREQAVRYAHFLFDRITLYPSLQLLERLAALIRRIEDDC
jgi:hypothetical protein